MVSYSTFFKTPTPSCLSAEVLDVDVRLVNADSSALLPRCWKEVSCNSQSFQRLRGFTNGLNPPQLLPPSLCKFSSTGRNAESFWPCVPLSPWPWSWFHRGFSGSRFLFPYQGPEGYPCTPLFVFGDFFFSNFWHLSGLGGFLGVWGRHSPASVCVPHNAAFPYSILMQLFLLARASRR